MPQGLTVPAWYNDNYYINEKVDECNTIKFGAVEGEEFVPWTDQTVRDFIAGAHGESAYAPWMGYDNFVSNGNAENCSPSRYFVVSEYLAAKAAQLNEIQYEDKTDWDQAKVLDAFRAANISAWDHYTTTGQQEGINPSNAFDNDAFFTAKCAILNAWQNEDGTVGYEGKDDWTKDDVIAVFQSLGVNPIMNQPENPDAASLVIDVPTDEQVSGGSFNPWGPTGPTEYNDITLEAGKLEYTGTDGNDNFIGEVTNSQRTSSLVPDTVIDGNGGNDMLTVKMSGNFAGFSSADALADIDTITLQSDGKSARTFNAKNTDGVTTWNLDETNAPINLRDLPATGVAINISELDGGKNTNIDFADASALDDSVTIGLDNVGAKTGSTVKNASVSMADIENVTLAASGESYIDLSDVTGVKNYAVTGEGDLAIASVASSVRTFDASEAKGDISADLTGTANPVTSILLGEGNDDVSVSAISKTAKISGGAGADEVTLEGVTGSYKFEMDDLETLTVSGLKNTSKLSLSGEDTTGLETLGVDNLEQNSQITFGQYVEGSLNVLASGNNGGKVNLEGLQDVTLTVGNGDKTHDTFQGVLNLDEATSLNINVSGREDALSSFTGTVNGGKVTDLSIVNGTNDLGVLDFVLGSGSNLGDVSQLNVTGFGKVDLTKVMVGANSNNLQVDATNLNASFMANFKPSAAAGDNATLDVQGSQLQGNQITVGKGYDSVAITGGIGVDNIYLDSSYTPDNTTLVIDRDDRLVLSDDATSQQINAWKEELGSGIEVTTLSQLAGSLTPGAISNSGPIFVPYKSDGFNNDVSTLGPVVDQSEVTWAPNQDVTTTLGKNQTLLVGDIPENGSYKVDATASDSSNVVYSGNDNGTIVYQSNRNVGDTASTDAKMPLSGTVSASFTASGEGDLTIAPATVYADNPGGTAYNAAMADIKSLALNTGDFVDANTGNGNTIKVGSNGTVGDGGNVSNNQMYGTSSITAEGNGDVVLMTAVGNRAMDTLTVSASGLAEGSFTMETVSSMSLLAAKAVKYTGSNNGDSINVMAAGQGTELTMGTGSDYVYLHSFGNQMNPDTGASIRPTDPRTAKIDLGVDQVKDQVLLLTDSGSGGSSIVTINNFVVGTDELSFAAKQSTQENATQINGKSDGSYTAAEWSGIISKFTEGEPIDAANIKVGTAAADKVAFVEQGATGVYDAYMLVSNKTSGPTLTDNVLSDANGYALVILDDITITGTPDFTGGFLSPSA